MNVLEIVSKIKNISKYFVVLLMLINLVSMVYAQGGSSTTTPKTTSTANLKTAMETLCKDVISIFGIAIVLMLVLAAAVYTAGQIMGAETRARANVWATAMLTGAVIGAIIYVIAPAIIAVIVGTEWSINNPCTFTIGSSSV